MRSAALLAFFLSACFPLFGSDTDLDCFYIDADGDTEKDDSVCNNPQSGCSELDINSDGVIEHSDCGGSLDCCEIEADGLCSAIELNVISIYQTHDNHTGTEHPMGSAVVYVERPGPQILVLSSYEPVFWDVIVVGAASLEKIIVHGYYEQAVNAPAGVLVETYSLETNGIYLGCAVAFPDLISGDGCETGALLESLEAMTSSSTSSFYSCYQGTFFYLGSDLNAVADCSLGGFADPDCVADGTCVGIDENQDDIVDRQDCNLSEGPECIFVDMDQDGTGDLNYCGIICGCVHIDWNNDGVVEPGTICNINADLCEPMSGEFQCINFEANGDGIMDTFCDELHSGCYYFDYSSNGTMNDNGCEQPDNPECPGIDENQDGVVDRHDCNTNAAGDCLLSDINDDGIVDSIYCGAICGCVSLDIDGDGTPEPGTLCNTGSAFCPPTGEECSPADLDLDGSSESYYCDSGCYLSDIDQSGTLDDYCQGLDGCYTLDLDRDGTIEDAGCQSPEGQCSLLDADGDGSADDTYCEDASAGCFLLDLDSDGFVEDENCGAPNGQCIGIDANGDGVLDAFDCLGGNSCVGVDFNGDGIVDTFVCPP